MWNLDEGFKGSKGKHWLCEPWPLQASVEEPDRAVSPTCISCWGCGWPRERNQEWRRLSVGMANRSIITYLISRIFWFFLWGVRSSPWAARLRVKLIHWLDGKKRLCEECNLMQRRGTVYVATIILIDEGLRSRSVHSVSGNIWPGLLCAEVCHRHEGFFLDWIACSCEHIRSMMRSDTGHRSSCVYNHWSSSFRPCTVHPAIYI